MMTRQMIPLIDLLTRAEKSSFGLSVSSGELSSSQLRRKIYNYRERLRREGITSFDHLSFVLRSPAELLIVKRVKAVEEDQSVQVEIRPLNLFEVPAEIRSRGKAILGSLDKY